MIFLNVDKKIKTIKKQLHNSFDVVDRVIDMENVKVGFIYLKSFTDNFIFSSAIYEPISNFQGNLDF